MNKLVIILLCCLAVAARAENVISLSSACGHPQDEVTLNLSLTNTDAAVAFQAEIPLGSQLTYVVNSISLNPDRITDHTVTAAVVNGTLKIYVYSLSLTSFVDDEGSLLSFSLKLKNEPGDYTLNMSDSKLSDASGAALSIVTQNGTVTILSPKLQINTSTLNYGHVPIRSEYTKTAQVSNVGNEPLTITGITFNDEVFSCPSFAETTLQPNTNANFTFRFAPMEKGAITATATIASNSISGNGTVNLLADPFAVNEIHVGNTMGYCDSIVELPISMNNMEDIIGFQIEANLNQALEYVDFTLSDRKTDHVATGIVNGTTLRLMAYSPSSAAFTGEDGVIGTVRFLLHGLYGNYYLNPSKAVLADANGRDALSDKYQGYITIRSPRINGNNSLDFGSTPVTETVTKEYMIRNNGNAPMRIDQIVFDQEDFAVAETFPITVSQNSNTTLHVSYSRELKGNFSALMKIYSNDPQEGLKNVNLSGSRFELNNVALSADPFTLGNGDVAITMSMNNYSGIVALQADFQYPHHDYFVTASDFTLTERFAGHSLYALPLNDSTYRVLVLSLQNNIVEGHGGVVLNLTLHPVSNPSQEEYSVSFSHIVLSEASGMNVFTGQNVVASFLLSSTTQSMELAKGWNWWTPQVYVSLEQLENALGNKGKVIKSQSSGAAQYFEGRWSGALENISMGMMYKIETSASMNLTLTGYRPTSVLFTIAPGNNWFGYMGSEAVVLALAFSSISPTIGDKIISQNEGFAIFNGTSWEGTLTTLVPGQGYVYVSTSPNTKTLTMIGFHP